MSNNNGKIIKAIAIVMGILGVIGSIIIALSISKIIGEGLLYGVVCAVLSVISSFVLYSFGELIEQVNLMSAKLSKIAIKLNSNSAVSNKASCVKPTAQQQERGNKGASCNDFLDTQGNEIQKALNTKGLL